ncbi:MAG: tetratricopeptide repeat protein, partial [Dongiaceae bacterium]
MDRKSPAPAGTPAVALETARRLVREARLDEAEAAYDGLLANSPDEVEALNFVAMRALARGRHAEAMTRLEQALRREPENPVTLAHLGLAQA